MVRHGDHISHTLVMRAQSRTLGEKAKPTEQRMRTRFLPGGQASLSGNEYPLVAMLISHDYFYLH